MKSLDTGLLSEIRESVESLEVLKDLKALSRSDEKLDDAALTEAIDWLELRA
jgi:hypothetical protein